MSLATTPAAKPVETKSSDPLSSLLDSIPGAHALGDVTSLLPGAIFSQLSPIQSDVLRLSGVKLAPVLNPQNLLDNWFGDITQSDRNIVGGIFGLNTGPSSVPITHGFVRPFKPSTGPIQ